MRVLQVNKFGWSKGGAEIVMLRTTEALARRPEIDVAVFAGEPVEAPGASQSFPVKIPEFWEAKGAGKLRSAAHVIWSLSARAELAKALDEFHPDVVHLHNYAHQLSPSIVDLLHRRSVPTVMTTHDYKLICPSYQSVRRGEECDACYQKLSPLALRDRCLHDSVPWTTAAVAEAGLVRGLKYVAHTLIAPSQYLLDRLSNSWLSESAELRLVRNPAVPTGLQWQGDGGYLLFVGRLSSEKGVDHLITWALECDQRLVIAGDGPEADRLKAMASKSGLITFVGHVGPDRLRELRSACIAQVLPSTWPENFPLAATEAAVDGIPLILSERGGMPELLELGARGALQKSPTSAGLREALDQLREDNGDLTALRSALDPERYLDELIAVYKAAA